MRHLRPPTLAVNASLVVLALAGAGWAYQTVAGKGTSASSSSSNLTVPVRTGTVTATVSASGSVASANTANAAFATSGTVTEIDVKVGSTVKSGQVLAKVDPTLAKAQLNTAKANLTAARDNLSQIESTTGATASAISNAQAQVASAQATVTADEQAVAGTVLKAPMAGTVIAVNGSVGNPSGSGSSAGSGSTGNGSGGGGGNGSNGGSSPSSSSSSTGFIQIADLSHMQAEASFAETDATKLKVGQPAAVTWSALAGGTATGKVASISPTATVQNNVNSYAAVVSLASLPTGARIGQTVTVVVTVAQADNVLRVPASAVTTAGGFSTVNVVGANGATSRVQVELGVIGDQYDEIKSGLSNGQQVAITIRNSGTGTTGGLINRPGGGGFPGGAVRRFTGGGPGGAG